MGVSTKRFALLAAILLPLLWQGCPLPTEDIGTGSSTGSGGTSSSRPAGSVDSIDDIDDEDPDAAPPTAGPDELPGPTALRFPTSVTIPVDDAFSTALSALTVTNDDGNPVDFDNLTGVIDAAYSLADSTSFLADQITEILDGQSIRRDTAVTSFEGVVSTGPGFRGWGLQIDFGSFSSARSATSTCSGNTQDLPVCFRVWIRETNLDSWQRIAAGYMTALPDDTGEGAGFFWFDSNVSTQVSESLRREDAVQWDHRDLSTLATEQFFNTPIVGPGGAVVAGTSAPGSTLTASWGADGSCPLTLLKSRLITSSFTQGGTLSGTDTQGLIGSWESCGTYWGGRLELGDSTLTLCLLRSNGNPVAQAQCLAKGVDVSDENFVSLPEPGDYEFPSEGSFPLSP